MLAWRPRRRIGPGVSCQRRKRRRCRGATRPRAVPQSARSWQRRPPRLPLRIMSNLLPVAQPVGATSGRWERRDKFHLAGITGFVLLLNVVGWSVLTLAVAPQNFALGRSGVYGVGLGVTAFLLGVRHAFDADHIAVIDNTTRKLVGEGKAALGVGFWFSLGHSTVVFGAALLRALGADADAWTGGKRRGWNVPDPDRPDEPRLGGRHRPGVPRNADRGTGRG